MGLVLYRKYRPKTFKEVVGQEHIVRTLENSIASGRVSHAYLFSGPRGTGKTTIARLLAKAVNCQNRKPGEFEPCNQCDSCREIDENRAVDLIEIDAASNRGIDDIRDLRERARFKPVKSKYKVFIIDESHQLTAEAANALLKTLEEPPAHAIFILATTEIQKMIPTIISRCQSFSFRRLTVEEISSKLAAILKLEKIKFEDSAINMIALSASGSIRDAESFLDAVVNFTGKGGTITKGIVQELLGITGKENVLKFLQLLQKKEAGETIKFLNSLIFKGVDPKELLHSLLEYLREMLILKINDKVQSAKILILPKEEQAQLGQLAKGFKEEELEFIINKFMEAEEKIRYASISQLPLELAIIEICQRK